MVSQQQVLLLASIACACMALRSPGSSDSTLSASDNVAIKSLLASVLARVETLEAALQTSSMHATDLAAEVTLYWTFYVLIGILLTVWMRVLVFVVTPLTNLGLRHWRKGIIILADHKTHS